MYLKSVYDDFCIYFEGKTVVLSTSPKGVIRGHGSIIQEVSDLFLGFIFSAKVELWKQCWYLVNCYSFFRSKSLNFVLFFLRQLNVQNMTIREQLQAVKCKFGIFLNILLVNKIFKMHYLGQELVRCYGSVVRKTGNLPLKNVWLLLLCYASMRSLIYVIYFMVVTHS